MTGEAVTASDQRERGSLQNTPAAHDEIASAAHDEIAASACGRLAMTQSSSMTHPSSLRAEGEAIPQPHSSPSSPHHPSSLRAEGEAIPQPTPSSLRAAGEAISQPPASPATTLQNLKHGNAQARLHNLRCLSESLLQLAQPPLCVDVGAKPEDRKIWDVLAAQGQVALLGFDPQCSDDLDPESGRRIVNAALGDGTTHTLHLAKADGMTSLLEADMAWLGRFPRFAEWGAVEATEPFATRRADEVAEMAAARFMKIDTQGSEKLILENAPRLLAEELVLLELELSPVPLYHGEPSFFAVGRWLEEQGWVLHHLPSINRRMFKPLGEDSNPYQGIRHIFQMDAVFMPHPDRWAGFAPERLLDLAFLAHALYGSFDLTALALQAHDAKPGAVPRLPNYRRYLQEAGLDA